MPARQRVSPGSASFSGQHIISMSPWRRDATRGCLSLVAPRRQKANRFLFATKSSCFSTARRRHAPLLRLRGRASTTATSTSTAITAITRNNPQLPGPPNRFRPVRPCRAASCCVARPDPAPARGSRRATSRAAGAALKLTPRRGVATAMDACA